MATIQKDVDLLPYNTFRVSVRAKKFLVLRDPKDLPTGEPVFALGQGANILFTKDIDSLVIKNELLGKKVISENNDSITIEVASGENWIEFVDWAIDNGWSGIENMAFIPGTAGSAAVGNIAAYGQNFEDICVSVATNDQIFSKKEMAFGYRESRLSKEKNKLFVTSVTIKLSKKPHYDTAYHSRYESLVSYLPKPPYTPKQVAEAVTKIRLDKLPDWRKIGTAGSFFKNPLVSAEEARDLQKEIAELQTYPAERLQYTDGSAGDLVKLPAGRLLDELGWKGKRIGKVGTWEKHALTVVNYGGATGEEILDFTRQMQSDIKSHFEIDLEPEVNIL